MSEVRNRRSDFVIGKGIRTQHHFWAAVSELQFLWISSHHSLILRAPTKLWIPPEKLSPFRFYCIFVSRKNIMGTLQLVTPHVDMCPYSQIKFDSVSSGPVVVAHPETATSRLVSLSKNCTTTPQPVKGADDRSIVAGMSFLHNVTLSAFAERLILPWMWSTRI